MADKKISALTAATTPLAGTEVLPIVQSSTTVKVAVSDLTAGRAVSAASLSLTTSPLAVGSGGTGTATAFSTGSVVFAGASGVYTQDNSNLYWDDTNNRLGLGTTSPAARLDVAASGSLIAQYRNGTQAYTRRFAQEITTTSNTPVTIDVDTGSSNALFTITVNCMSYTGGATYYNNGVGRGYLFPSGFGISYDALATSGLTVALSYVNNTTVRVTITDTVSTTTKAGVCEIVVTST